MRVALVCYYSPPQSAVASHRVLRMTRALLAAGHQVQWVTADAQRLPESALDAGLASFVPPEVKIWGIDGQALCSKPAAANLWEKIGRNIAWHAPRRLAIPDSFLSWARQLRRRLPGICRAEQIDAVILCCSPHNQILVIPELRRVLPGIRILVDYRDLCSGNPWNSWRGPRLAARMARREGALLRHADRLFVNTDLARRAFRAAVGEIPGLAVEVLGNAADFALAAQIAAATPAVDLGPGLHLGFFGTLFPRRRLTEFFNLLASVERSVLDALQLHVFCGRGDSLQLLQEDLAILPRELQSKVRQQAFLPYVDALRQMQAMDGLVLINGPSADDAVFVPGKVYDYLMARRPVLFMGHPGECADIIAGTSGPDWVLASGDAPALTARLAALGPGRHADLAPAEAWSADTVFAPLLAALH